MGFAVQPDGTIHADTLAEALQVRAAILQRTGASKGGANRWKNLSPEQREKLSAGAAASSRKYFATNPGKGSISLKGGKFGLMICVEGRPRWAGTWPTLAAAEDAQRQVLEARKAGLPLPPFVRPNRSQSAVDKLVDELPAEESAHAPIWPEWPGRAPTMGEGRDQLPPAIAIPAPAIAAPAPVLPAPPALQKGTPEWRARVAEALRASWARRRAAAAEQTAPDPGASGFAASDEDGKQEVLAEPQDTHGLARLLLAKREPVESLDHLLDDDDEGTDLTDLVDVPEPEPTAIPDLDVGRCGGCGQIGHQSTSPLCPLSSEQEEDRPPTDRPRAEPRSKMPPSFTETPLTMRRHLHVIDLGAEPVDEQRPRTRGECENQPRPCPFVSCRYHMALDVLETGNLHRTFGDMDLAEMPDTCALDVADRDGATLEEIGRALNVSRERIRQIETLAIESAKKNAKRLGLRFEAPDEPRSNAPEDAL